MIKDQNLREVGHHRKYEWVMCQSNGKKVVVVNLSCSHIFPAWILGQVESDGYCLGS